MRKQRIFIIFLFFFCFTVLNAQEYQQLNARFLPPDYYVGDTVELKFTLRSSGNPDLIVPETLPDPGWVKLLSLRIAKQGGDHEITIRFIPYYPGTRTLPALVLGDLTLKDIKIYTSSVLGGDTERELSGIRNNLIIPGTRVTGAVIFSMLLCLPLLIIIFYKFLKKRTGALVYSYKLNLPYRKFLRLLKRIRQTLNDMSDKEFFTQYTDGLKSYLSTRFHKDFTTLTTTEMESVFRSSTVSEPLYLTLLNLFHRMDRVKFAGEEMTLQERDGMLSEAEQISVELENWRKKHADL